MGIFNKKLKTATGVELDEKEAALVIKEWEDEASEVYDRQGSLLATAGTIEKRLEKLKLDLPDAAHNLRVSKQNFKRSKSPLAQRKWARKLVLHSTYHTYLRESHINLTGTISRVKDAVEDAKVVYDLIQNRVADAKIYNQLNGGLQLVGKALIDAKNQHQFPEIEYKNLEFTMEKVESEISSKSDKELLNQASQLLTQGDKPETEK